jgi:hypothetical protein
LIGKKNVSAERYAQFFHQEVFTVLLTSSLAQLPIAEISRNLHVKVRIHPSQSIPAGLTRFI